MLVLRKAYPCGVGLLGWAFWLICSVVIAVSGTAALLLSTNSHSITVSRFQQGSGGAWGLTGSREADLKVAVLLFQCFLEFGIAHMSAKT